MKKSLHVITSCDGCGGSCCQGQAALPVHLVGENFPLDPVTPLPPELAEELRATVVRFKRDGFPPDDSPCIWLDGSGKCSHYEYRPTLCRDAIRPGDESCRRIRRKCGVDPKTTYVIGKRGLERR